MMDETRHFGPNKFENMTSTIIIPYKATSDTLFIAKRQLFYCEQFLKSYPPYGLCLIFIQTSYSEQIIQCPSAIMLLVMYTEHRRSRQHIISCYLALFLRRRAALSWKELHLGTRKLFLNTASTI